MKERKTCKHPGCKNYIKAKGYCNTHYKRLWAHGDANVVLSNVRVDKGYATSDGIPWPASHPSWEVNKGD